MMIFAYLYLSFYGAELRDWQVPQLVEVLVGHDEDVSVKSAGDEHAVFVLHPIRNVH